MRSTRHSIFIGIVALLAFSLALSGCSTKGKGSKDGSQGAFSESSLDAQREARFGSGGIPTAEGEGLFRDVRFGYDSAQIDDMARQDIEYNVQILKDNPDLRIQLEGHCDERGTAEYNLTLGSSRAQSVKDMLLSYGVPTSRMDTISYGEEVPLADGSSESAYQKNRRVHFSPFKKEMAAYGSQTGGSNIGGGFQDPNSFGNGASASGSYSDGY